MIHKTRKKYTYLFDKLFPLQFFTVFRCKTEVGLRQFLS